jgi:glycosyltransferase involved in cell wall biosynthesis
MKVMFLCSSLELGKDGVGDYTRLLAEGCTALGLEYSIIALQDRHVTEPLEALDAGRWPVLRLPAAMPWSQRVELAIAFRNKSQPDWISLQFVSYGFDTKGFVWNLGPYLRRIVGGVRVHVMFHELWIGSHDTASWKDRLMGYAQRVCILRMIRRIAPTFVTTSNGAYIATLTNDGIQAELLPLFGNIPLAEEPKIEWFHDQLRHAGLPVESGNRSDCRVFAFFGTLHPEWCAEPLFSYLSEWANRSRKKIVIASIGRLGSGEALWTRLSREYAEAFHFITLGEQPASKVSGFLQSADFGIAASPWELIGKSGSVAGMLEHGLPVIVSRDDVHFAGFKNEKSCHPGLTKMNAELPARLPLLRRQPPQSTLPEVAAQFIRSLRHHSNNRL